MTIPISGRPGDASDPIRPRQEAPVGPEGRLGCGDQAVLVALGGDLLDQLPDLGGVFDVAGRVLAEVRGRRRRRRTRTGPESGTLGPRDRGLAALDRVEAHQRLVDLTGGGPSPYALARLRGRRVVASPPAARTNPSQSATWARSSSACSPSSGRPGSPSAASALSSAIAAHGVAVLARVAGELIGAQIPGRPAAVEGMAEDVPPLTAALNPIPGACVHRAPLSRRD